MARRAGEGPGGWKARGWKVLGWLSAATLVAFAKLAPARQPVPLGPAHGQLAEGLPPERSEAGVPASAPLAAPSSVPATVPAASVVARPTAAPTPAAAPNPTPRTTPLKVLAAAESALVRGPAARPAPARPGRRDWRRELPRPFAELRRVATPLIMPRLELPRVLATNFVALRGLAARARPGQAVHVKLTAYCLAGATRRGTPTRAGIVAADPRIFPMARHVHLFTAGRYLGRFRVEDTGAGVRGPHLDIWTPDCADARRFGTRPGVASLAALGDD